MTRVGDPGVAAYLAEAAEDRSFRLYAAPWVETFGCKVPDQGPVRDRLWLSFRAGVPVDRVIADHIKAIAGVA